MFHGTFTPSSRVSPMLCMTPARYAIFLFEIRFVINWQDADTEKREASWSRTLTLLKFLTGCRILTTTGSILSRLQSTLKSTGPWTQRNCGQDAQRTTNFFSFHRRARYGQKKETT